MWQGKQTLTDNKPRKPPQTAMSVSLLNELNDVYVHFDKINRTEAPEIQFIHVDKELSRINTRQATSPDGAPGRVLRACAVQLAGIFTEMFNLCLAQTVVPPLFLSNVPEQLPLLALTPIVMKCFQQLPTLDPHILP